MHPFCPAPGCGSNTPVAVEEGEEGEEGRAQAQAQAPAHLWINLQRL